MFGIVQQKYELVFMLFHNHGWSMNRPDLKQKSKQDLLKQSSRDIKGEYGWLVPGRRRRWEAEDPIVMGETEPDVDNGEQTQF